MYILLKDEINYQQHIFFSIIICLNIYDLYNFAVQFINLTVRLVIEAMGGCKGWIPSL